MASRMFMGRAARAESSPSAKVSPRRDCTRDHANDDDQSIDHSRRIACMSVSTNGQEEETGPDQEKHDDNREVESPHLHITLVRVSFDWRWLPNGVRLRCGT